MSDLIVSGDMAQRILDLPSGILPEIVATAKAGSTVTCTNGDTVLTAVATDGTCIFKIPFFGVWTVKGKYEQIVLIETIRRYFANTNSILPEEYQELSWIKSDGAATIRVPINIERPFSFDLGFEITENFNRTWDMICGVCHSGQYKNGLLIGHEGSVSNQIGIGFHWGPGFRWTYFPSGLVVGEKCDLHVDVNDLKVKATLKGEQISADFAGYNDALDYFQVCGVNDHAYPDRLQNGAVTNKVHYFTSYTNGTKTAELIPCYEISTGVGGMYNMTTKTFLTTQSGGSFEKGADV